MRQQFVGDGVLFLLQVAGNSMIEAAIADGDWVVVRQQPRAENGEIVAAMVDGEATIYLHWMTQTARAVGVEPELLEITLFQPPGDLAEENGAAD